MADIIITTVTGTEGADTLDGIGWSMFRALDGRDLIIAGTPSDWSGVNTVVSVWTAVTVMIQSIMVMETNMP